MQAKAEHERAERLAEELRRRRGNREDIRAQVEREAEASVKLQMQQRDFEWRQKYQVLIVLHLLRQALADTSCPWAGYKGLQNILRERHRANFNGNFPVVLRRSVGIRCLHSLHVSLRIESEVVMFKRRSWRSG